MGTPSIDIVETRDMFLFVAMEMLNKTDMLTQADKAIGDGDHGIGMARGFEAVQQKLIQKNFESVGALMQTIGTTLMMSIGGAAGAIFGTFFRGGAGPLMDRQIFDSQAFAMFLSGGLEAVKNRGRAKPGDKTMVDALEPASVSALAMVEEAFDEALAAAAESARDGMEHTKNMVAAMGKAKTLGERAVGHPDPGALSTYFILSLMSDYLQSTCS
ncbi:MAG: dihydroxyacetone kinase subunit DhaL [Desulfobacterales bacterium]|nr:dihydroxyacetone kinase subunit DhaL [Desulfobacterales bacterium]